MKIVWAENPLSTRVELDTADLTLLKERLKSQYLEDCIVSACCDLDAKLSLPNQSKTPEERIAAALRTLDIDYLLDDVKHNGKSLCEQLDERAALLVQDLLNPHVGDCICVACSCAKCYTENLLGINTLKGLEKHAATKINAAFANLSNIKEAILWLETYQLIHDPNSGWAYDQWVVHVPRWIEEGKMAHAWLTTYCEEHFAEVDS